MYSCVNKPYAAWFPKWLTAEMFLLLTCRAALSGGIVTSDHRQCHCAKCHHVLFHSSLGAQCFGQIILSLSRQYTANCLSGYFNNMLYRQEEDTVLYRCLHEALQTVTALIV